MLGTIHPQLRGQGGSWYTYLCVCVSLYSLRMRIHGFSLQPEHREQGGTPEVSSAAGYGHGISSGFSAWGFGFRVGVWDLGFRVWDLGFRVWGFRFRYLNPV